MAVYAYEKVKTPKEKAELYKSQLRSFYGSLENAVNYRVFTGLFCHRQRYSGLCEYLQSTWSAHHIFMFGT